MKRRTWFAIITGTMPTLTFSQPRRASVEQTTKLINDCERRTNDFKKTLDSALGRNAVRLGEGREQQLNRDADRLENEMDKVGDSWNHDHDLNKTRGHVATAIAVAKDINRTMVNWPRGDNVSQEWAAVKTELNRLAQTFNLPRITW